MLNLEDVFTVPEEYVSTTPCIINNALFTDPALDVDQDDEAWLGLTEDEQTEKLIAKTAAEQRAKDACDECPVFSLCDATDRKQTVKAFGIVAGRSLEERTNPDFIALEITRGATGQNRNEIIKRLSQTGMPNRDIAAKLGCHPRTVERHRAGLAAGSVIRYGSVSADSPTASDVSRAQLGTVKVPKRVAGNPLQPARVTSETAAIYDALLNGAFRDRSEILDLALPHVDRQVAFDRAPKDRVYPDEQTRVNIGARKFLMNRVDIAVRSGRIDEVTTENGRKLIALEANTLEVWKAFRS
jgi:hypothetical protein